MEVVYWSGNKLNCELCNYTFTYLYRPHHCRACGRCVCSTCSPHQLESKERVLVRVCQHCYKAKLEIGHEDDWEVLDVDDKILGASELKNCQENALPLGYREKVMRYLLTLAIQGSQKFSITSTTNRHYVYVQQNKTREAALVALKQKASGWTRKVKSSFINSIPILGFPPALICPLWHQLRLICLVASLYDHNLHSEETQAKIISCLTGHETEKIVTTEGDSSGNFIPNKEESFSSVPNPSGEGTMARAVSRMGAAMRVGAAVAVGWGAVVVLSVPVNLLIEWLTDHSEDIFQNAKDVFSEPKKEE